MKALIRMLAVLFVMICIFGCTEKKNDDSTGPTSDYNTPKYIFFFIGDGMGTPQVNAGEVALINPGFRLAKTAAAAADITLAGYNISTFPVAGMSTTYAQNRYITDSAASGTALATGKKTYCGIISKDCTKQTNYKTMAEMAKDKGMKVGIISSVSIDHATPGCFYAHEDSRNNYYSIAAQMATSGFNYFGGGYAKGNFASKRGANTDVEQLMTDAGYTLCDTKAELDAAVTANKSKVWAWTAYDGDAALNYEMDRTSSEISLAEFTQKGIELLQDDPDGFFMMIEGGKVDWACHANDAVAAIHDMVAFDNAIGKAIAFYNNHKDQTLIVVTGDHECGGMTLGWGGTEYESAFDLLKHQSVSYQAFTEKVEDWVAASLPFASALDSVKHYFGLGNTALSSQLALSGADSAALQAAYTHTLSYDGSNRPTDTEEYLLYGPYYESLTITATHILNNKAGMSWTSYQHTGVPVPVFAMGEGDVVFSGYYDNTDIAKKIIQVGELQ